MAKDLYEELLSMNILRRAWHLARNDARTAFVSDAIRYNDFAFNFEDNLQSLRDVLASGDYHPGPLLRIDVPKSTLAVRPGSFPQIEDLIVGFGIVVLIAPKLDGYLSEGVYSYRLKKRLDRDSLFKDVQILKHPFLKRRTIQHRVNIVESWYGIWPEFAKVTRLAYEEKGFNYLGESDIAAYFENINIDILRDLLLKYLPKQQRIVNLLTNMLDYWSWRSYEGRRLPRGIPQGNTVSSFLGNIYLLPLDQEFKKFGQQNEISYFRYMDDVRIFAKDEAVARKMIFLMNDVLRGLHLNIQGSKTAILRGSDIEKQLIDDRFDIVNDQIKTFERQRELTASERDQHSNSLKRQYRRIKCRKRALTGKDLRLFRRLLTGFRLLDDPYLVSRTLLELERNPDARLIKSAIGYFRRFPGREKIAQRINKFLQSPINLFAQQEALLLSVLRYFRDWPGDANRYARRVLRLKKKHWYVRVEAALLLSQEVLRPRSVRSLRNLYKNEPNEQVRRALLVPLCQLDRDDQIQFLREVAFERCPKTSAVAGMLTRLREDANAAQTEVNSIFRDWSENKLLDNFYKVEVIRHSENDCIQQALLRKLKSIRRFVRRPRLSKKVNITLEIIKRNAPST